MEYNNTIFFSDIEDSDPSDSFVVDQPVTFEVVAGGTERRSNKLISSDGYSYTVKVFSILLASQTSVNNLPTMKLTTSN